MYEKKQGRNSYWYEFIAVRILNLHVDPEHVWCAVLMCPPGDHRMQLDPAGSPQEAA